MSNGVVSSQKPSFDIIYEISKYALDNEWDLFKTLDTKAQIILTSSTTLLSIYIGILFFFSEPLITTSSLFISLGWQYWINLFPVGLLIFLTSLSLILSISYALQCLKIIDFIRAPDPIEVTNKFYNQSEIRTKLAITKSIMKAWSRNHDFFNLDKQIKVNKSFINLYRGIAFLMLTLVSVGTLLLI